MTINVVSFHAKKLNKTLKTTASHYYSLQILKWPFWFINMPNFGHWKPTQHLNMFWYQAFNEHNADQFKIACIFEIWNEKKVGPVTKCSTLNIFKFKSCFFFFFKKCIIVLKYYLNPAQKIMATGTLLKRNIY